MRADSVGFRSGFLNIAKSTATHRYLDVFMDIKQADGPREEIERKVRELSAKLQGVAAGLPDTPSFLGQDIYYPKKKRRLFGRMKRPENLSSIRKEIGNLKEGTEMGSARQNIKDLLKKYPYCADLRALNGIQIFSDVSQSGLVEKKMDIMGEALKEIAIAIHNGSFSLFNITWLARIYIRYLDSLHSRMKQEMAARKDHYHWQVQKALKQLQQTQFKLESLIGVRAKLGGISVLNKRFKGSDYTTDCISKKEIEMASIAVQKDMSVDIGNHKTAAYILMIVVTSSLLLARIPMMETLVTDILNTIPDFSRDLILQKTMIGTMMLVTKYQISVSAGEKDASVQSANKIYSRSIEAINNYVGQITLVDPHEVDPFLKAAWIAKESKNLLNKTEFETRLRKALQLLKVVQKNPREVKGAIELVSQLRSEIHLIMNSYGWAHN